MNVDKLELRLVDRAAAGEPEARRELFERHRQSAFRVALRITGREADALDVVQDAFIRAFENLAHFQRGAGFKTWLLRIVSNRALDVLRARRVRLATSLDGPDDEPLAGGRVADSPTPRPDEQLERAELAERLRRALESLPPEQRAVLVLFAEGEMSYGQVAEALGIPVGTVMSRLFHARRRLNELLSDLAPQRGPRSRADAPASEAQDV